MSDAADTKRRLRAEALARRNGADAAFRAEASRRIAERAVELYRESAAGFILQTDSEGPVRVGAYSSFGSEVDTAPLIEGLLAAGAELYLPRMMGAARGLEFRRVHHATRDLVRNPQGIAEPHPERHPETVRAGELDLLFLPGIAFDREGNRLGYGKGYYDRLLGAAVHAGRAPFKAGVAFGLQVIEAIPAEEHDVRLDALVTEAERLEFR